ncbi:hypothetical protein PT279_08315 [Bifidobacterium sp. ESL0784]|uniref:hypothetical protein n=1 Tax=Bifidobacterium sp. ESL0784 TaxID=2983231 RepID=UPI0023F65205|nr:hypothetical protein [Bifidobacterium sp. ESL0784]MDF7641588.1 hypothetical protein [Bifidobacterium sp. ESL0784]
MQEDEKRITRDVATSTTLSEDGNNAAGENEYAANKHSMLLESKQPQDSEVAPENTVTITNVPDDPERLINSGSSGDSTKANSSAQDEQHTSEQIRRKAVGHQAAIIWGFHSAVARIAGDWCCFRHDWPYAGEEDRRRGRHRQ